jgi:ribonuclease Z
MRSIRRTGLAAVILVIAGGIYFWGVSDGREGRTSGLMGETFAAGSPPGLSPMKARARDFYAPNTEDLRQDEMRLIACGTGMPTARPKQAASCWLLELGNGDKFIFDVGTGSAERIAAMQIPYNYLDKVFRYEVRTGSLVQSTDLGPRWARGNHRSTRIQAF